MNPVFGYFNFTLTILGLSGTYHNNDGMIGSEIAVRANGINQQQFVGIYNTTWEEQNHVRNATLEINNRNNSLILLWTLTDEAPTVRYEGRAIQINPSQIMGDYDMIRI